MDFLRITVAAAIALGISCALSPATEASQRVLADSLLPAGFQPSSATPMQSDGFWSAGMSNGIATLVRYDSNGAVRFLRYPAAKFLAGSAGPMNLFAMPDGGVASTDVENIDFFDQSCVLRRFDADGHLLWMSLSAELTGVLFPSATCSDVYVDGTGGIWLYPASINGNYIASVNQDGTNGVQIPVVQPVATRIVADPVEPAVYLAGTTGNPNANPPSNLASVQKITTSGVQWSVSAPPADIGSELRDIARDGSGNLWAFGRKGAQLYGMQVRADGNLIWSNAFPTLVDPAEVRVVPNADGTVSTVHWNEAFQSSAGGGTSPEASRFSATGSRLWNVSTGLSLPQSAYTAGIRVASAPDGDLIAAVTSRSGDPAKPGTYLQQSRLDGSGASVFLTPPAPISTLYGIALQVLPDNTSLAISGAFDHRARNGQALAGPASSAVTTATSMDDNELMAPDGSAYLVTTNQSGMHFGISAYSATGSLRWHTAIASSWDNGGLESSSIALRANDICLAAYLDGDEIVQCFALADGTAAPRITLASGLSSQNAMTQATSTPTGALVLLYLAGDGTLHHAAIDSSGVVLHDVAPLSTGESWRGSSLNSQGEALVTTSSTTMVKLDATGRRGAAMTADLPLGRTILADDGSMLFATNTSPLQMERLDANGTLLWRSALPTGYYNTLRSVRTTATDVYFALVENQMFGNPPPSLPGLIVKQALGTGAIGWSAQMPYAFVNSPQLTLNADATRLYVSTGWSSLVRVRQLDTSDGQQLSSGYEPCGVDQCTLYQILMAPDGTLRMVLDTSDLYSGSSWEIITAQPSSDIIFADAFSM